MGSFRNQCGVQTEHTSAALGLHLKLPVLFLVNYNSTTNDSGRSCSPDRQTPLGFVPNTIPIVVCCSLLSVVFHVTLTPAFTLASTGFTF